MPGETGKIARLFEMADDTRARLVRVETAEELEQKEIAELRADVKALQASLNQVIGKNAVMAAIYGVIGTIIASVVAFIITQARGS